MNSYYKLGFCLSPKLDKFLAACAVSHFESSRSSMTSLTWARAGYTLGAARRWKPCRGNSALGGGHALGTRVDWVTMGERV